MINSGLPGLSKLSQSRQFDTDQNTSANNPVDTLPSCLKTPSNCVDPCLSVANSQ